MSVFRARNTPDTGWTVPTQRRPHPMEALTDSPTERLHQPPDDPEPDLYAPDRHRGALVALTIASLAVVASGATGLVAWQAARRTVNVMPKAAHRSAAPTTDAAPVVAPLLYAREALRIEVACGDFAMIDLDRPPGPAAGDERSDLRYDNRCGPAGALLFAGAGARAVSHVAGAGLSRRGCADAIGTDPLEADEGVLVVPGAVLCVATAETIALVEVAAVGAYGAVALWVTGWTVTDASDAGPGD